MKIFLVRHGQSMGNINQQEYFDKLDCHIELTQRGFAQAKDAAQTIVKLDFLGDLEKEYHLFCSTYKRAQDTKDVIQKELAIMGKFHVCDKQSVLLREREWGDLRDILRANAHTDDHWNFYYRPLRGESFADCFQRAAIFDLWMETQIAQPQLPSVIVAHGEFIKCYLMYKLRWTLDEFDKWKNPKNCEVYLLDKSPTGEWRISAETPLTESHGLKTRA